MLAIQPVYLKVTLTVLPHPKLQSSRLRQVSVIKHHKTLRALHQFLHINQPLNQAVSHYQKQLSLEVWMCHMSVENGSDAIDAMNLGIKKTQAIVVFLHLWTMSLT
jgi:hypothetical protein